MHNEKGRDLFDQFELEAQNDMIHVETIAPEGLGYGKGPIGVKQRLENTEDPLNQEICQIVEEISTNPDCTVEVSKVNGKPVSYDNCPDGRKCCKTVCLSESGEVMEETAKTYTQKVFGGGLTMGVAGLVGNGQVSGSVTKAFETARSIFARKRINYGAHTSTHANDKKSDCGAIDNAPVIISNALEYEHDIRGSLDVLFGEDSNTAGFQAATDIVFDNYREFSHNPEFKNEEYSGAAVMEDIADSGKIIKVLEEDHREVRVRVIIDGKNQTSDQARVRRATDGVAQIFAIDVPRMREIATQAFETDEERKQALISMVVYSLSVAATLTQGDLPVDIAYTDIPYIKLDTHEFALAN